VGDDLGAGIERKEQLAQLPRLPRRAPKAAHQAVHGESRGFPVGARLVRHSDELRPGGPYV
jgi:hypothetical protein